METYPTTFIEEYLSENSLDFMKIMESHLVMNCLEFFENELYKTKTTLLIDNSGGTNTYIKHSVKESYYFAGLNDKLQLTTKGWLARNPSKGLDITAINDRYIVLFKNTDQFEHFLFNWIE